MIIDQIKTRNDLFLKIAIRLFNEDLILEDNFTDHEALIQEVAKCIEKEMDSFAIIKGSCDILE